MRELSDHELGCVAGGWDPYHNPLDPPQDVTDFSDETEAYIVVPSGAWVEDSDGNYILPDEADQDAQFYFGADEDKDGIVDRLEGGWVHMFIGGQVQSTQIPSGPNPI